LKKGGSEQLELLDLGNSHRDALIVQEIIVSEHLPATMTTKNGQKPQSKNSTQRD